MGIISAINKFIYGEECWQQRAEREIKTTKFYFDASDRVEKRLTQTEQILNDVGKVEDLDDKSDEVLREGEKWLQK